MNKRIINIIIGILIVIALPVAYLIGYNSFKVTNSVHNINNKLQHKNNYIDKEKVKELVLNHLKVSEDSISDYSVELDVEHNKVIYEVSFDVTNLEYEYELDAVTGEIISKQIKNENTANNTDTTNLIDAEKAKAIALEIVPNGTIVEVDFDKEDVVPNYDVKVTDGEYKYEYEINAKDGSIITESKELIND